MIALWSKIFVLLRGLRGEKMDKAGHCPYILSFSPRL